MEQNGDKILIVDDTPKNLQVLGNLLQNHDYLVEFATNGQAALEWVKEEDFDLILLDVMMPEMDGFEVCRRLKNNGETSEVPIIFLTARTDSESIVKGFTLGAADYVSKPFNKEELLARIETQLTLKKSKEQLVEKNRMVVDSLKYAKKIQQAMMTTDKLLQNFFAESTIFFKPRDIVSGDFFWIKQIKNFLLFTAADCTGHGVPGAFMSMLGISILNEITGSSKVDSPAEILNRLRKKIKDSLHQTGKDNEQKDGMDLALCMFDKEYLILNYAGAYNPLYIIRNEELIEYKADRQPIAIYDHETPFTNHEVQLEKNDVIYICSDGFADQVGGDNNKKYKTKYFKELLIRISKEPLHVQNEILNKTFYDWKGNNDQIDDIIIIGIRV